MFTIQTKFRVSTTAFLSLLLTTIGVEVAHAAALTLEQALSLAEQESPWVKAATAEKRSVIARDVGASIALPSNPIISAWGGPRRERAASSPAAEGIQFGLRADQEFEIFGQRGTRREAVRRAVDVATSRQAIARNETRARTRALYMASAISQRMLDAAKRQETLAVQLLDAVRIRVQSGAASDIDLRLAEIQWGQSSRLRIEASRAVTSSFTPLRLMLGLEPSAAVELSDSVGVPATHNESLDALISQAYDQRAELLALRNSRLELDAQLSQLSREALPNPIVFVEFQRDLPRQNYVGLGIAVPLPTFRRNQGEKALVNAAQASLDVENTLAQKRIGHEVEAAFRAMAALREEALLLEEHVLPAAESSVSLLTEGWKAGKFDLFRVIQATKEASDARRGYFETLGNLWMAVIELERAIGKA